MAGRRFVVTCTHCNQVIVTVTRIAGAELDRLQAHLLACCPNEMIGPSPGVEAVMRHFRVAPTIPEPPPDAA